MTTKHTPGPWNYRPDSSKHGEFVVGPANSAPTASNVVAFAVLPHNAPLIAAAPDLLAALEAIQVIAYAQLDGSKGDMRAALMGCIRQARAAITKAKGE